MNIKEIKGYNTVHDVRVVPKIEIRITDLPGVQVINIDPEPKQLPYNNPSV